MPKIRLILQFHCPHITISSWLYLSYSTNHFSLFRSTTVRSLTRKQVSFGLISSRTSSSTRSTPPPWRSPSTKETSTSTFLPHYREHWNSSTTTWGMSRPTLWAWPTAFSCVVRTGRNFSGPTWGIGERILLVWFYTNFIYVIIYVAKTKSPVCLHAFHTILRLTN